MSSNPAKYEALIKHYLRSILDVSENLVNQIVSLQIHLYLEQGFRRLKETGGSRDKNEVAKT